MNTLKKDIQGLVVVVSARSFPHRPNEAQRLFVCESGPGCFLHGRNVAITGHFVDNGDRDLIDGYNEVEKLGPNGGKQ